MAAKNNNEPAAVKKKRSPMAAFLGIILILILLFAGFVVSAWVFDLFGVQDYILNVLGAPQKVEVENTFEIKTKNAQIEEKDASITDLTNRTAELQAVIDQLERDKLVLTGEVERLNAELTADTALAADTEKQISDLVRLYENMKPKSAAQILVNLTDNEQVASVLTRMKKDVSAQILAAMPADKAAVYTRIMLES